MNNVDNDGKGERYNGDCNNDKGTSDNDNCKGIGNNGGNDYDAT